MFYLELLPQALGPATSSLPPTGIPAQREAVQSAPAPPTAATAPTRPLLRHHHLCFHPHPGCSRNSKFAVCVSLFLVYHSWRTETPRWGSSCHLSSGELGALDSTADPSPVREGKRSAYTSLPPDPDPLIHASSTHPSPSPCLGEGEASIGWFLF